MSATYLRMMNYFTLVLVLILTLLFNPRLSLGDDAKEVQVAERNAFWVEISRSVGAGDFEAYAASCHPDGVLVSGTKKLSSPLSEALARWKKEFVATEAGKMKASVEFRFSQRFGDETTAHETGIFLYSSTVAGGTRKVEWIHFEQLLVKKDAQWKTLMEYQKAKASQQEWDALDPS